MGKNNWTRDQLIVALGLYCKLRFGQFHRNNALVIEYAERIGRTPSALAMKLSNFASLDAKITESGRSGLKGASALDKEIWNEFMERPAVFMAEIEGAVPDLFIDGESGEEIREAGSHFEEDEYASTKRRKGQGAFREAVLSSYEFRCCVTGLEDTRFLVASHIKPWAQDKENRLNPHNGLCLSTLFDRAFDIGLISFSDDFRLMVSSQLKEQSRNAHISESFLAREGVEMVSPSKFYPDPAFLTWHRSKLFKA